MPSNPKVFDCGGAFLSYKTMFEACAEGRLGKEEPSQVLCSPSEFDHVRERLGGLYFNAAKLISDNSMPPGTIRFHNPRRPDLDTVMINIGMPENE